MNPPTWSQDDLARAYKYAAVQHNRQRITDSELPYIVHCSLVTLEVVHALEPRDDCDLALQCAILHDVVEDTDASYQDVERRFGKGVADGVQALSKNAELPKLDRMADSLRRIRRQPREIWKVKLADRIVNMRKPPASWGQQKRRRYQDAARLILRELGDASQPMAERLGKKISDYDNYIIG